MNHSDSQHRLLLAGLLFMLFIAPFDEGAGRSLVPWTCVTITAVIVTVALVRRRLAGLSSPVRSPLLLPLLLFFGVAIVSVAWSIDRYVTLLGAAGLFACAAAALLVLTEFNTAGAARTLCLALVILGCLLAPLGVLQAVLGRGSFAGGGAARAHSVFVTPNTFAGFLIIVLPMAVALALTAGRGAARVALWCAAALLLLALAMSLSRGAWVAGAAGMGLLAWQLGRARVLRIRKRPLAVAGVVLLAAAALLVVGVVRPALGRRAASVLQPHRAPAFQHRLLYWDSAVEMAAESFPLGIGLETYHVGYPAHQRAELAGTLQWYAHNDYLQVLVELGPLGLLALLWLLWRVAWMTREVLRSNVTPADRALVAACCAGAGAALLHSLVDYNLYVSATALPVFVCFGIIASAHRRLTRPEPAAAARGALAPALSHVVLAAGTAAVFFALRPVAAEQLVRRSRFNAPIAVTLCPMSAHLWSYLGDTQAATHLAFMGMGHVPGDAEAAETSYLSALERSPRAARHHARLGQLLLKKRKLTQNPAEDNSGLECLRRACALDGYAAPLRWQLGTACLKAGLVDEGRRELRFCLDRCRPDDRLRKAIATVLSAKEWQKDTDGGK